VSDANNNRVLIFNIGDSGQPDLGPQFSQGKSVVGKVFWDLNGDGVQDAAVSAEVRNQKTEDRKT